MACQSINAKKKRKAEVSWGFGVPTLGISDYNFKQGE